MSTAALAGLVLLLAISFWRPLRRVRTALGLSHLAASGYAFLIVGVAAGLAFGAAGGVELVGRLDPIIAFATGWIGFAAGSRFEWRVLRRVPLPAFARGLAPAFAAAAAVGAASAYVLLAMLGAPPAQGVAGALCLAAAAASASPTLAAVLRTRRARRSREARGMLRMIELSAGLADGLVVLLALVAFVLFRPGPDASSALPVLGLAIGGAALLGAALWLFLAGRAGDDERLLLGLGMLAMIAGLGGWLEQAPAAIGAIAGAVLGNLPGDRATLFMRAVRRVERPVVVILMATIGMHLATGIPWQVALLVGALTALRLAAKLAVAGRPSAALDRAGLATPTAWTAGLTPQGILSLVVALSFYHVWHDPIALAVLGAVALGGLANELLGSLLLMRIVRGPSPRRRSSS